MDTEVKEKYNIYCDESCHLENDHKTYMVMGAIKCNKKYRKLICQEIREIKEKYGINKYQELKWTKISKSNVNLYKELINYFFSNKKIKFRAIIVDKSKINNQTHNQTHDEFYYKMYYQLLNRAIVTNNENYIYLDIKDTKCSHKIQKLKKCLQYGKYDFNVRCVKNIQSINSKESELLQLCDVLIGAIGYLNREESKKKEHSTSKEELTKLLIDKSGYNLKKTTFLSEDKFNLFFIWEEK